MNKKSYQPEGDLSRFEASPAGIEVHTNESLVCRDCAFRARVVGSCEQYPDRKPKRILKGGKRCANYRKDPAPRPWEDDYDDEEDEEEDDEEEETEDLE